MVRLAILLVGANAVRRQWAALPLLGALWIALGAVVLLDVSNDTFTIVTEAMGAVFVLEGALVLASTWAVSRQAQRAVLARAAAFVLIGLLIMDLPLEHNIADSVLFALVFVADALLRIVSAWVVRFQGWRLAIGAACLELLLGVAILADWPWPHRDVISFSLSLALTVSGLTLVRLGLQLRNLPEGASITELPMYRLRPWPTRGPVTHSYDPGNNGELTLYVWTAAGSIEAPVPRPVVNRYIAAIDRDGVVSTGHAALGLHPDLYISLYPAVEMDHSPSDFARMLRAGIDNDVPGRWNASYEAEVAQWRAPDRCVTFRSFNEAALRHFWQDFRQDETYNLTSRSCSTAAALALECALEGSLRHHRPWRTFFVLMFDPYMWVATVLRYRGVTMAWTPGLVLDYGRALRRVLEREHLGLSARLGRAWRWLRRRAYRA